MAQATGPSGPQVENPKELRELLHQFEQAWRSGTPPRIETFLKSAVARRKLLEELIKIDLEYRWRQSDNGAGKPAAADLPLHPCLEDYTGRFAELGRPDQLPVELIAEEYRVRLCWGDRPRAEDYVQRFPQHPTALRVALAQTDAELAEEHGTVRPTLPGPAQATPVPPIPTAALAPTSAAALLEACRRLRLLSSEQLDALVLDEVRGRYPDVRSAGKDILKRGWLTAYQVNLLLQGRGADLVLGQYVVLERLGEGGAGQVFKARHRSMNRIVAVKVIRKELLDDAEVVQRFYREIQLISQLSHPNIIHAFDAGPIGTTHVLTMEYVQGVDLSRLVKESGPLPVAQACAYIRQTALGLQYAHERGLVHRDIKPANLLIADSAHCGLRIADCGLPDEGHVSSNPQSPIGNPQQRASSNPQSAIRNPQSPLVKILDLGLARLRRKTSGEVTSALTKQGDLMVGTLDYLAPEQALDFHAADIRADIYSLGCTFFYLLTGQPPFPKGMLAEKLLAHQQAEPPAVEKLRRDVTPGLAAILRKMMAKRPEDRFQAPKEVADALSGLPVTSGRVTVPGRRRVLYGAVASVVVLGTVGVLLTGLLLPRQATPDGSPGESGTTPPSPSAPAVERQLEMIARLGKEHKKPPFPSLVFRPDGKRLARDSFDKKVQLWDLTKANPAEVQLQHPSMTDRVPGIAFRGDKVLMASRAGPKEGVTLTLWELAEGAAPVSKGEFKPGPGLECVCLAFAPDNESFALATHKNGQGDELWVWNLKSDKGPLVLVGARTVHFPESLQWGRLLACGKKEELLLWDVQNWNPNAAAPTKLPPKAGTVPAFAPNNQLMATAQKNEVRLWDLSKLPLPEQPRTTLKKHGADVHAIAFAADGTTLASADATGQVIWWDATTGKVLGRFPAGGDVNALAIAPDGRQLAVGNADSTVWLLRLPAR